MPVKWRLPFSIPCKCLGPHLELKSLWDRMAMNRLVCFPGKLLMMYGQTKLHMGEKSERPSLECLSN